MGVRMFTTARQMEMWSHAQAIYDLMGMERPAPSARLRNIAEIGVRTFGWTYRIRDLPVPPAVPSGASRCAERRDLGMEHASASPTACRATPSRSARW